VGGGRKKEKKGALFIITSVKRKGRGEEEKNYQGYIVQYIGLFRSRVPKKGGLMAGTWREKEGGEGKGRVKSVLHNQEK